MFLIQCNQIRFQNFDTIQKIHRQAKIDQGKSCSKIRKSGKILGKNCCYCSNWNVKTIKYSFCDSFSCSSRHWLWILTPDRKVVFFLHVQYECIKYMKVWMYQNSGRSIKPLQGKDGPCCRIHCKHHQTRWETSETWSWHCQSHQWNIYSFPWIRYGIEI